MSTKPTTRLRTLRRLQAIARTAGRLDAQDQLGNLGMAVLSGAMKRCSEAGCLMVDVTDATLDGLCDGRWESR